MNSITILTDASIQLPRPTFSGRNLIEIIPFHVSIQGKLVSEDQGFKISQFPASVGLENLVSVSPLDYQEILNTLCQLCENSRAIIAITISSKISPLFDLLEKASVIAKGKTQFHLIDSQTTGIGLGYLVLKAAEMAARGDKPSDIEYRIRGYIPKIYSQICVPNISYLHKSGMVDKPQALVGEMLNVMPVYTFEEGRLISSEKVKNPRHLLDSFQEFIDEFSDLETIAVTQSVPPLISEIKGLRDHSSIVFPGVPFIEQPINLVLAGMFGPRAVAVYAVESLNGKN